jgi:hypothetical protein
MEESRLILNLDVALCYYGFRFQRIPVFENNFGFGSDGLAERRLRGTGGGCCCARLAQSAHLSMRRTFSVPSISFSFTSITSFIVVCTVRPTNAASIGNSRWPRSIRTQSCTRRGRP